MKNLKRLFKIGPVYHRPTLDELVISTVFISVAFIYMFISLLVIPEEIPASVAGIVFALWLALAAVVTRQYVIWLKTQKSVNLYQIDPKLKQVFSSKFDKSVIHYLHTTLESVPWQKMMLESADTWAVYSVKQAEVVDRGERPRTAIHHYYTVFEGRLPKKLPQILFDGIAARSKQFDGIVKQVQHVQLEGDFINHFEAYSPVEYERDMLSFITPDVMESLIALRHTDIEIIEDRLLVFGPMMNLAELKRTLEDFKTLHSRISKQTKRYKDYRSFQEWKATEVTPNLRTKLFTEDRLFFTTTAAYFLGVMAYLVFIYFPNSTNGTVHDNRIVIVLAGGAIALFFLKFLRRSS